jgi:hypothetical protein
VPHGYALLAVDVRGRYDSGGVFEPVVQERRDAPDLMAWLGAQSWLDRGAGVGTVGLSYLATAGFLAAADNPLVKAATCVTVVVDSSKAMFHGGALNLHHAFPWCVITGASPQPDLRQWNWPGLYRHLPLATLDAAAGFDLPLWRKLLGGAAGAAGPSEDLNAATGFGTDISADLARCRAPVLHMAGWYDFIFGESMRAYEILSRAGHAQQSLILGPWDHSTILSGQTAMEDVDFGPESTSDLTGRLLRWFDYWLRGKGSRPEEVAAFITGGGGWKYPSRWPPEESSELRLYLDGSRASGPDLAVSSYEAADRLVHSLTYRSPVEGELGYTYDPADPTPTIGGAVWPFRIAGLVPGPADQRPLLDRDDGLFFLTRPLDQDVVALGPVRLHLVAGTDAPDTDFAARLVDIEPGGAWRIIQDGIARVREAGGDPLRPGEIFRLDIDCRAAGHRFANGHRIGVHLAGASFPKYARNLNTGGDPRWETSPRKARHLVRLGPSYLSLSVAP